MSKQIAKIKGNRHLYIKDETRHIPEFAFINTFYNGIKYGKSVQITIDDKYIHLTKVQCNKLIKALQKCYKE